MNLCKVQGFFCRLSLHLKIVLGSKLYKPLQVQGFFCRHSRHLKCNFGSKLVILGGEHRLFTGRRFSPPMTSPFLGKFWHLGKYSFIVMIKLKPGLRIFCSSLTSTFRLADTVSMEHANEVFSLEKTESKTKRFTWVVDSCILHEWSISARNTDNECKH